MNDPAVTPNPACVGIQARVARQRHVDVIVVGGGPAGCSTALALSRAGFAVTILERSHYATFRIGETLPPEARQHLTELGVWEQFLADGYLESPGIASSWGSPNLYDNDFIVSPYGPRWHLDRRRFDITLARAAQSFGVGVLRGARGISLSHVPTHREGEPPGEPIANPARPEPRTPTSKKGRRVHVFPVGWLVSAVVGGQQIERRAAILVDATGRSSSVARRFGRRCVAYDRLAGLIGIVCTQSTATTVDHRTLVEAVEEGWWYAAPLPDGSRIAVFLTDADLIPVGRSARDAFWAQQIRRAPHTMETLGWEARELGLRVVSARSARLNVIAADDLLAVGDAAASFDPLSSQGITWALESGLAAASAIGASHRGDRHAIHEYARWVDTEFGDYLIARSDYYAAEQRWPRSAFWARRHTETSALHKLQSEKVAERITLELQMAVASPACSCDRPQPFRQPLARPACTLSQ
jgi:2-polyprenyl-6-methoxyphenol hydroxylase-like FAD-dependent oxidoreductase